MAKRGSPDTEHDSDTDKSILIQMLQTSSKLKFDVVMLHVLFNIFQGICDMH